MNVMMGHGPCINCGELFSYNPDHVPSITVAGKKEPICGTCITAENARRAGQPELDLPQFEIHPMAYEPQELQAMSDAHEHLFKLNDQEAEIIEAIRSFEGPQYAEALKTIHNLITSVAKDPGLRDIFD